MESTISLDQLQPKLYHHVWLFPIRALFPPRRQSTHLPLICLDAVSIVVLCPFTIHHTRLSYNMLPQTSALDLDNTILGLQLVASWQIEQITEHLDVPEIKMATKDGKYGEAETSMVQHTLSHVAYSEPLAEARCLNIKAESQRGGVPCVIALRRPFREIGAMMSECTTFEGYYRRWYLPSALPLHYNSEYPAPYTWLFNEGSYEIRWTLDGHLHYQPNTPLLNLPSVHTPRGLRIIHQILLDLNQVMCRESIQYLALYNRDLITPERVSSKPAMEELEERLKSIMVD